VRHALQVWSEQGHCAAPREKLVAMAVELLDIPEVILQAALAAELEAENLVGESLADGEGELVYLTPMYQAETGLAHHVCRLLEGWPP
jgi:exodeoxyribonuclease V alpha subunit